MSINITTNTTKRKRPGSFEPISLMEHNLGIRARWTGCYPLPHIEHTQTHLDVIHGADSTYVRWIFLGLDERGRARPPKQFFGTLATCYEDICAANRAGYGIFVTISAMLGRARRQAAFSHARAFFIDDDKGQSLNLSACIPDMIVESRRGLHGYWRAAPHVGLAEFTTTQLTLAAALDTDPAVSDGPRVMRLAGTWHNKEETPFLVRVTHASPQRPNGFTSTELRTAYPPPAGTVLRGVGPTLAKASRGKGSRVTPLALPADIAGWPEHLRAFLTHFDSALRVRDGFLVRCPAHSDRNPSLLVGIGQHGHIMLCCRSRRCGAADIIAAMRLPWSALFAQMNRGVK